MEPVEVDGDVVSSTRIREAIAAGDVAAAAALGGAAYLEGLVVWAIAAAGRSASRPPTCASTTDRPCRRSASTRPRGGGGPAPPGALVSIGTRPTFDGDGAVVAEVHLLDYDGDLYGALLGVELVARLRDEQRFDDADALVEQMHRDVSAARSVLETSLIEALASGVRRARSGTMPSEKWK